MEYNTVKDEHDALQAAHDETEELLQTLLTGLSSSNTKSGGGYMGQIEEKRKAAAQAEAEAKQFNTKLTMRQEELKGLQAQYKKVEREAKDSARNLESMRATVESFKKKVAETGWSQERETEHEAQLRDAKNKVRHLTEVCFPFDACPYMR